MITLPSPAGKFIVSMNHCELLSCYLAAPIGAEYIQLNNLFIPLVQIQSYLQNLITNLPELLPFK
jgi:hypothetical protein